MEDPGHLGWMRTPLYHASREGKDSVVMNLLSAGATTAGLRDRNGSTLLHAAACGGSVRILTALIIAGCEEDVDVQESQFPNRTPLLCAVWYGRRNMIKGLVAAGADPEKADARGQTALHLASIRGHASIVSDLLEMGLDIEARDAEEYTPLACAVASGKVKTMKMLLDAGASIQARTANKLPMLDVAIKANRVDCLRVLLAAGANPEDMDQVGLTALLAATRASNVAAIAALVDAGADVESRGLTVWTPLHFACHKGNVGAIEALVARGGDLKARTSLKGSTPLHIAAGFLNRAAVKDLLLRWGADEAALDARGQTPSDVAGQLRCVIDLGQQHQEATQLIRFMLANAPADRSWIRRRIVMMLVSRERTRLSQERMRRLSKKRGSQVADSSTRERTRLSQERMRRLSKKRGSQVPNRGKGSGNSVGAGATDISGEHVTDSGELSVGMTAFRDAVMRLAGMDESVFWRVMTFL